MRRMRRCGTAGGGLSIKLQLAVDGNGRPLAITLTGGQRHPSIQLQPLLDGIGVTRLGGHSRPRKRPAHLLADRGYSHDELIGRGPFELGLLDRGEVGVRQPGRQPGRSPAAQRVNAASLPTGCQTLTAWRETLS